MARRDFARFLFPAVFAAAVVASAVSADAQTFTVIHNFTGGSQPSFPAGHVSVLGRDGNLYAESYQGGSGNGTIFNATPTGTITVLHDLEAGCSVNWLSAGSDGNIYGACGPTSKSPNGYIFEMTTSGTFADLHDFNGSGDGANPVAPFLNTDGNIYGVTNTGGANNVGTFYKFAPKTSTLTTLFTFSTTDGKGYGPQCIPTPGSSGALYCTTLSGGANGLGTVFSITTSGKFTLLHTFAGGSTDGGFDIGGVILGSDGNFYGTSVLGGTSNQGTVFKMTTSGTVTVLHSFNGTTDGGYPANPVTQGSDGNLYGTANDCLHGSCGTNWTAFKCTKSGSFTVLHTFNGSSDGKLPDGGMLQLTNGTFYGVSEQGGSSGDGTLWTINTGIKPFVLLSSTSGKVGSKVGIQGEGFNSSSVVKFNGTQAATTTLTGTTYIVATVPTGATDGHVTVTTGSTTLTSTQTFIVHNSWSKGALMPTAVFGAATGAIGTKVYVVGGGTSSAVVNNNQIYNTVTNKWTTGAAMPTARFAAASAVVNGILYVIGGCDSGCATGVGAMSVVEAYDPASNTWTTKAPLPTATDSINAVVEKGIIYVVGGYVPGGGRVPTVFSYNPATDTWATEAPLAVGKSEAALGLLGSTIVAAGGYTNSGVTGDNEGYSASTNTWKSLAADPTARQAGCVAASSGLLYFAGGAGGGTGPPLSVNESFSATANKWTTLMSMPLAVIGPGSAEVNNLLYCFGGSNNGGLFQGTVYNNVQIYQP